MSRGSFMGVAFLLGLAMRALYGAAEAAVQNPRLSLPFPSSAPLRYNALMTKLLDEAIAKVRSLPDDEQDALALAMLSMTDSDAAAVPLDDETRAAIREGLAQAERGEFVPDEIVAESNKRHGI
jgi:predicted transcriptional regulator